MSPKAEARAGKSGMSYDKLLNITAASEYLQTSRNTTWRFIKSNKIKTYANPLDMRETLVSKEDLDQIKNLLRPKKRRRRRKGK